MRRLIPLITFAFLSTLPFQAAVSKHIPAFPDYAEAGAEEETATTPIDLFVLGCNKLKEGKLDEAYKFTEMAIELNRNVNESDKLSKADLAIAYSNYAILSGAKGDPRKALHNLNISIEIDPSNAYTYTLRGELWEHLGRNERAIADYNKSGIVWSKRHEYDQARISFNKAINLDPDHPDGNNNMAWLLSTCSDDRIRNGDQALELAKKAVKIKEASYTLDTLAAAYAELGRFQEAIETQERAIEMARQADYKDKVLTYFEKHLSAYKAGKPWRE